MSDNALHDNLKECCIIIPIYNITPTKNEVRSIKRTFEVFHPEYDIYYVCSEKLDVDSYKTIPDTECIKCVTFSDAYFKSNKTYSRLLLSEVFYNAFVSYKYMLIAQTDTYIINTGYKLSDFISMGYDYIGAQWEKGPFYKPYGLREIFKLLFVHNPSKLHVGNGGFSLRNVRNSLKLVKNRRHYIAFLWRFNEDLFFSSEALKSAKKLNKQGETPANDDCDYNAFKYLAAPEAVAKKFALETNMKNEIKKGNIPFAVHAFEKYYPEIIEDMQI